MQRYGKLLFMASLLIRVTLGSRSSVLGVGLAWWACSHYLKSKTPRLVRPERIFSALALAAICCLMAYVATALRSSEGLGRSSGAGMYDALTSVGQTVGAAEAAKLLFRRFDMVENFAATLEKTGRTVEPQYGATFLDAVTMLVPRAFWPGKPTVTAHRFGVVFLDDPAALFEYSAPAPSWPGELYWNFYGFGIVFGFLLTGFFCRLLYEFLRNNQDATGVLIYVAMMPYMQAFAEGGIGGFSVIVAGNVLPVILAYVVCVRFKRDFKGTGGAALALHLRRK